MGTAHRIYGTIGVGLLLVMVVLFGLALPLEPIEVYTMNPQAPEEPKRLTCYIFSWNTKGAKLTDMFLRTSDGREQRVTWMEIRDRIILPAWFTYGKEVQVIRSDKLKEEWLKGTPGVYKMQPLSQALKDSFPDKKFEISSE